MFRTRREQPSVMVVVPDNHKELVRENQYMNEIMQELSRDLEGVLTLPCCDIEAELEDILTCYFPDTQ